VDRPKGTTLNRQARERDAWETESEDDDEAMAPTTGEPRRAPPRLSSEAAPPGGEMAPTSRTAPMVPMMDGPASGGPSGERARLGEALSANDRQDRANGSNVEALSANGSNDTESEGEEWHKEGDEMARVAFPKPYTLHPEPHTPHPTP